MALRPIKLRLGDEELHLVSTDDLRRAGGVRNGSATARVLVRPENAATLRRALLLPSGEDLHGELRRQLEDGSAVFFEIPPAPVAWDRPETIDIHDLSPIGGEDGVEPDRPTPHPGLHWIEVVCLSADGGTYPGARARVRLPDGRSPYVTLDARSSIRFDDLSASGTVHFELSGDALAQGRGQAPTGQRYTLGSAVGLSSDRRHVLLVHPNPDAFVSVQLLLDETPVALGRYALRTSAGEEAGDLAGEPVRADGFALPSVAAYGFEGVLVPPRPVDEDEQEAEDGSTSGGVDDDAAPPDAHGAAAPIAPDAVVLALAFSDGSAAPGARAAPAGDGDEREVDGNGEAAWDGLPAGTLRVHLHIPPGALPDP